MKTQIPPRVLIIEDHQILRDALRAALAEEFDVIEAASAEQGYRDVEEQSPDVVILDLSLPGKGGLTLLRRIHAWRTSVPVLVLSMYTEASLVRRAMELGASAYVSKQAALDILVQAVNRVLEGETYLDPLVAMEIGNASVSRRRTGLDELTAREMEVFLELTNGAKVDEIAARLSISPNTVANHRRNLMEKLGARNSAELVRIAAQHQLVSN